MKNQVKKQSGYTMVELTIGITVASLVLSATLMGVQKMMDSMAMNRTVSQITSSAAKIKSITSRDNDNSFITDFNMTRPNTNAFSDFAVVTSGASVTIRTAKGLRLYTGNSSNIGWAPAAGGAFRYFIEWPSITECVDLAGQLEGAAQVVAVRRADASWGNIKNKGEPYSADKARAACTNIYALVLEFSMQ